MARPGALANQVTMMAKSKVAPMFDAPEGLKGYVGEEDGFDPLRLSDAFDMKWLREAEIKHGRICMLAFTGFVFADLCPLPGVTLSSVAAHDANLGEYGGAMGQIFWWIGLVEVLGSIPAINYTMNGGDRAGRLRLRPAWLPGVRDAGAKRGDAAQGAEEWPVGDAGFQRHRDSGGAWPSGLPLCLDNGATLS